MSSWPGRVAKAVEEGTLYVTAEEYDALAELLRMPGPTVFEGPGFEVHLNGILIVVDDAQAGRQAEVAQSCLCVEIERKRYPRLCPLHGPDSAHQRLIEGRRRLADDIRREALARLRPDAQLGQSFNF